MDETAHMDYETAKSIVRDFFRGDLLPAKTFLEALKMVSEDDYNAIQKSVEEKN